MRYLEPLGYTTFEIKKSEEAQEKFVLISSDVATCDQCLSELLSPQNFRYRYPFINCTLCGPRFTIIKDIPYDRHKTTMAPFTMCPICQKEYEDPTDRRFHAQPNACSVCGPSLRLKDRNRKEVLGHPIEATLNLLGSGLIVAIKGLGGFHLACDAKNQDAVSSLRSRKYREDKPFAVMCRDLEEVKKHCEVDEEEERLLLGVERPMVIDPIEIVRGVVHDLIENVSPSIISGKFHRTIASLIINTCEVIRSKERLNRVALSGGVFQNILLLSLITKGLQKSGFEVYTHHSVPTNDGGISLGQAVICHMRLFQRM